MQQQLEKLEERLGKIERRPVALVNSASSGSEASPVVIGKTTTFKIPTFDGAGPWKLHHKQLWSCICPQPMEWCGKGGSSNKFLQKKNDSTFFWQSFQKQEEGLSSLQNFHEITT